MSYIHFYAWTDMIPTNGNAKVGRVYVLVDTSKHMGHLLSYCIILEGDLIFSPHELFGGRNITGGISTDAGEGRFIPAVVAVLQARSQRFSFRLQIGIGSVAV